MNENVAIDVHILDKEYRIMHPPAEREALISSARYLDERMREIRDHGRIIGTERIAVMAALNITHELLQRERNLHDYDRLFTERLRGLIERIDIAVSV